MEALELIVIQLDSLKNISTLTKYSSPDSLHWTTIGRRQITKLLFAQTSPIPVACVMSSSGKN